MISVLAVVELAVVEFAVVELPVIELFGPLAAGMGALFVSRCGSASSWFTAWTSG
jgi:hypothetical protein